MDIESLIRVSVSENLAFTPIDISRLGKGASDSVYRAFCPDEKKEIAVKISEHPELMRQEYEMLSFLKENTGSKIPKVYFFDERENTGIIAMQYIKGVSGTDSCVKFSFKKKRLAESIIDNLIVIQQIHGEKFGPYNNAVYDTWQEYYKTFAKEIYDF